MEIINIEKDIKVYCITADSFPEGINDALEKIHSIIPFSTSRRYFGISRPEQGVIVYRAAAEELEGDKENGFGCKSLTIKNGKYISIAIHDYLKDIHLIARAFEELINYPGIDPNGYCIEWYDNDKEVTCMVRLDDVVH